MGFETAAFEDMFNLGTTAADIERAITTAVVRSTQDAKTALVEGASLGYKEGMRTETRPAPSWRGPIADYVRHMRAARRSEGTIYLRSYHLRVMSNAFRNRSPWSLQREDIEEFLSILGRHVGRNTQRSYLASIRMFFRFGVMSKSCQIDPCEWIDKIAPKVGVPRPAMVEVIQESILNAPERERLMLQLAATGGLRVMEIAALHTKDIVQKSNGYAVRIESGKGDKTRVVPIPPLIAQKVLDRNPGYVFASDKGTDEHLKPGTVSSLMSACLPAGVTPHMIRHRFATDALKAKRNLRAVQELLGHASVATTQIYTEVEDDELRFAANAAASHYLL